MEKMAKDGDLMIKSPKDDEDKGLKHFIWNSDRKEFCGRSGSSWLKIGIFYVIFYLLLAGFWSVMLLVFYQTLDYYTPKWTLDSSRIGSNPGLGFRPLPHPDNVDSTLIYFRHGGGMNETTKEWSYWVNSLHQFVKKYDLRQYGEHVKSCDFDTPPDEPRVCPFVLEKLGNNCTFANHFGYDVGRPCMLLKLNRIYGWKPRPYKNNDSFPATMPDHLRKIYDSHYVYISCQGENPADKENIGLIKYYPENGAIPSYYYPFTNLDGYLSPFVFVHFTNPSHGVLINVECKAWADNIHHDRNDRLGCVHFELFID